MILAKDAKDKFRIEVLVKEELLEMFSESGMEPDQANALADDVIDTLKRSKRISVSDITSEC